jgi:alpha-methylacyl-CoA racemase
MRVLDLSLLFPGPYCASILAYFGADVVKIERPGGGDWVRYVPPLGPDGASLLFHALNRGKRSLTLNLRAAEGQAVFLRLVETADVLLEGFRPGVMDRLGLGYQRLAAANPRLVYCALTGYGPQGPYHSRAGHDLNYVGLAGLLDLTGTRDGPPVVPGVPVADVGGALWAAIGILQALLERETTGRGQRVDASLLGGALGCLPLAIARHAGGQPMARGADHLTGGVVCYQVYETKDGGYMSLAALEPEFWAAFCQAAGREDLLGDQFSPAAAGEPAFEAMRALFLSRTRDDWTAAMAAADACCEPVFSVAEALDSPVVQALQTVVSGLLCPPLRLSAQQGRLGDAPALGEHTEAVLGEAGYSAEEIERLRTAAVL